MELTHELAEVLEGRGGLTKGTRLKVRWAQGKGRGGHAAWLDAGMTAGHRCSTRRNVGCRHSVVSGPNTCTHGVVNPLPISCSNTRAHALPYLSWRTHTRHPCVMQVVIDEGATHTESAWAARLPRALRFLGLHWWRPVLAARADRLYFTFPRRLQAGQSGVLFFNQVRSAACTPACVRMYTRTRTRTHARARTHTHTHTHTRTAAAAASFQRRADRRPALRAALQAARGAPYGRCRHS